MLEILSRSYIMGVGKPVPPKERQYFGKEQRMIYLNNIEKTIHKPMVSSLDTVTRRQIAELICRLLTVRNPDCVYLTEGGRGTELSLRAFIAKGDHVIVTASCGERIPEVLENLGAEISVLPDDPYLAPGYEKLDELFRPDTRAVVCAHGIRATGNVTDLERICAAAKQHNALVIADGSCTCGAVDVSLEILSPDVYCFSGENMLMGPEGIGGICLRQGFDGRPLQKLLEEEPAAFSDNILRSFAASLQFILDTGIYGIAMLPHRLAKRFFESAKAMDGVTVCGDYREGVRLPVVAVRAEGFTAEEISQYMKERGILIGTENDMARFSFGYFNTRPQVKETVQALMDMMGIDEPYLLP